MELIHSEFPNVRLIALGKNVGFAAGNNIGIRAARGEYIALLNNDTEPEPLWLIDSAGDQFWTVGVGVKRGEGERDVGQYDQQTWVFGASAAAALYRRTLFESLGL